MKKLAIISRKGGTGKTTLAIHLAVEAERSGHTVILIDLDPQASATRWKDHREDDTPFVVATPVSRLAETLSRAKESGATFAVIDTAPHTETAALDAAIAVEMVLIPCKAALVDLEAIPSTVNIIRIANVPARIVFNAVPSRGDRVDQAREAVKVFDIPCAPCSIGDRVAFIDSYNAGLTAQEYDPRGKASQEIQDLYVYISNEMEETYAKTNT